MNCDMCGKNAELYKTDVEGAIIQTCKECASYGKIIARITNIESEKSMPEQKNTYQNKNVQKKSFKQNVEPELIDTIVDDFHLKIKNKREQLGLKQEELANILNEKISLMQQIESKKINLNMILAKKLEKYLNVKLIEQIKPLMMEKNVGIDRGLTLADMANIKIRKRK